MLAASRKLPVSCITTSLGASDSMIVVDSIIQRLQLPTGGAIVECHCRNTSSAHDLLTEIAENMRNRLTSRDITGGGRETKRQATTAQDLLSSSLLERDGMVQTINRMPLEAIAELLFSNIDTCCIKLQQPDSKGHASHSRGGEHNNSTHN